MGRIYTGVFNAVSVVAVQDFFELLAPSDATLLVYQVELHNVGIGADAGDAEEEMYGIEMARGVGATSGSGGSTVTTQPKSNGDGATGAVLEANNTTLMVAGGGSVEQLWSAGWNIRVPFDKLWIPELRPVISPSDRFTVELTSTPTDAILISGTISFEELGG